MTRRSRAFLLLLGLVAACAGEPDYPPTSEGHYLRYCSRCHEADGNSKTASKLAKEEIDLRDPVFQKRVTDGEIAYIMEFGVGQMQGVANLTPATVDSILIHVRRLGRKAVTAP